MTKPSTFVDHSLPPEPDLEETSAESQVPRNSTALKNYGPVLELARIQRERGLPDSDFARVVKFALSGSSWGKIRTGSFSGNCEKAAAAVRRALTEAQTGKAPAEVRDGVVLFDHVLDMLAACQIARAAKDEHRVAMLVGEKGSGKTVTLTYLQSQFPGSSYMHAHPSWNGSYLSTLVDIGNASGYFGEMRSVRAAEHGVLSHLEKHPRLLLIDEANHFGKDGISFLKMIVNETRCAIAIATLPMHLHRMNMAHNEETQQLIRRAVIIRQIPPVDSDQVSTMHATLFPGVVLNGQAAQVAQAANRFHKLDTVARIFAEVDPEEESTVTPAIQRVERMIQITAVK